MPKGEVEQRNSLKASLSQAAGVWLDEAEKVKKLSGVDRQDVADLIAQADEAMQAVEDLVGAV